MDNGMKRTAAQEIILEEARLTLFCLRAFSKTTISVAANGIGNVMHKYIGELLTLEKNLEGEMLAKEVTKEQAKLILMCMRELSGSRANSIVKMIKAALEHYVLTGETDSLDNRF